MSTSRIATSSTHPPYQPERRPTITSKPPPTPRVTPATMREIRAPKMMRLRMSRPNLSVPSRYSALPPARVPDPVTIKIVSPRLASGSCSRASSSDTWYRSSPLSGTSTTSFSAGRDAPQKGGRFRDLKLPSTGSWGATQLANIPRTTTAPSRTIGIIGRRRAVRPSPSAGLKAVLQ